MRNSSSRFTPTLVATTLAAGFTVDPMSLVRGELELRSAAAQPPKVPYGTWGFEVYIESIKPFRTRNDGGDEVHGIVSTSAVDQTNNQLLWDPVQTTGDTRLTEARTVHGQLSHPRLGWDQFRVGYFPLEDRADVDLLTHVYLDTLNGPHWKELSKKEKFDRARSSFREVFATIDGILAVAGAGGILSALGIGELFGELYLDIIYLFLDEEPVPDGHCDGPLVDAMFGRTAAELWQLTDNPSFSHTDVGSFNVPQESWNEDDCGNLPSTEVAVTYRRTFLFGDSCPGNLELRPESGAPASWWYGKYGDVGDTWADTIEVVIDPSDVTFANKDWFFGDLLQEESYCADEWSAYTPFLYEEGQVLPSKYTHDTFPVSSCNLPGAEVPAPVVPVDEPLGLAEEGPSVLASWFDPHLFQETIDTMMGLSDTRLHLYGAYDPCGTRRGSRIRYMRYDAQGHVVADVMLKPSFEPPK